MRRLLFLITLALYGFSAMELHEWLHVPQVVMHFLEEHTSEDLHGLFHADHDGGAPEHHDEDHAPFEKDCHGEFCACGGLVAIATEHRAQLISCLPLTTTLGAAELPIASGAFTGGVWNPPKA
jgi:hypothetical protein